MKHFLVMELYKFIHLLTRPKLFNTEQSCFLMDLLLPVSSKCGLPKQTTLTLGQEYYLHGVGYMHMYNQNLHT